MATSTIVLVTCLLVGAVIAQSPSKEDITDICVAVEKIIEDDGFDKIETHGVEEKNDRKKRGIFARGGSYGGGYDGCGAYPGIGVSFLRCFVPGRTYVQNNHIVHSYYRQGNYGNCLNYFRSLPLTKVETVSTGYVGHIHTTSRSYTVNACQNCYGGHPGISIRCDNAPYSYLTRQFVFRSTYSTGYSGYNSGYNGYNAGYNGNIGSYNGYGH